MMSAQTSRTGRWVEGSPGAVTPAIPGPMPDLVGVSPLVIQQILALDPAGEVVTQAGCHNLPQIGHLALGRRLHLGVYKDPSLGAHSIDCRETQCEDGRQWQ